MATLLTDNEAAWQITQTLEEAAKQYRRLSGPYPIPLDTIVDANMAAIRHAEVRQTAFRDNPNLQLDLVEECLDMYRY